MRRDIASAYAASGARILSWVIISAIVYRLLGAEAFALLALIRATIGLLNYSTLGLAPAMVRLGAAALARPRHVLEPGSAPRLDYEPKPAENPLAAVWSNGQVVCALAALVGAALVAVYAVGFLPVLKIPPGLRKLAPDVAILIGAGTVFRMIGDVPGAILQTSRRITLDNLLSAATDLLWVPLALLYLWKDRHLDAVAVAYMNAAMLMLSIRWFLAGRIAGAIFPRMGLINMQALRQLASFGLLVVVAQLADYLYAPVDYVLINRWIGTATVAVYAPAVQIDAGLLVLVAGLANVLLPKSALAHAAGDASAVRGYYLRGTLASAGLLIVCGAGVWAVSPWLFSIWLGDSMPATRAILPLVLVHTVLGGSSAVGRSVLLGMGKVRAFAAAAMVSGVVNVGLSWFFVAQMHLGLRGIIYGTIVAVVGRCVIWMPWYVMKEIGKAELHGDNGLGADRQDPQHV